MLRINVMKVFLNRLRDRGWKNVTKRGFTNQENQILTKGSRLIISVEQINIDASVDVLTQVDDFFHDLMQQIRELGSKIELFLPGGVDVQIPDFFKQFCEENDIRIHVLSLENYLNYADFL